jgi:hypothetical protein
MTLANMWGRSGASRYDTYGNPVDSRPQSVQSIYTSTAPKQQSWVNPNLTPMSAPEVPTGRSMASPYSTGLVNSLYDLPYTGSLPTVDPNSKANPLGLGGVNTAFQTQRDRGNGIRDMSLPVNKQFYSGLAPDPTLSAMSKYRNGSEAGEFMMNHGVDAFLGGYTNAEFGKGRMTSPGEDGERIVDGAGGIDALRRLAMQTGYSDYGKYANSDQGKRALYDDLNTHLKDYWGVSGKDPRASYGDKAATRALYKDDGTGQLQAVSNPRVFAKPAKDNGFIGREGLTALSMVLPMFGGWAGMLGQGAAGTLSAGSGLGLTTSLGGAIGTGATNALVNAGMGALTNGSGGQGFLTGLLGQGLNAGMGSITGGANNLSNLFNTANAGSSVFNPMSAFRENLGRIGLGNSSLGAASRFGPQAIRGLSALFSR